MFLRLSTHLKRTWYLPSVYLRKSLVYAYLSR